MTDNEPDSKRDTKTPSDGNKNSRSDGLKSLVVAAVLIVPLVLFIQMIDKIKSSSVKTMPEYYVDAGISGKDLTKRPKSGDPPFWTVFKDGDVEQVKKLLNWMPETNKTHLITVANSETNNNGQTILAVVIAQDNLEKYKAMQNAGINLLKGNADRHLFYASESNRTNIARYIVENDTHRKNINARDKIRNWTPLMYAAHEGHLDLCKYLVEKGADFDKPHDGNLPDLLDSEIARRKDIRRYIEGMRKLKGLQPTWGWGKPNYNAQLIRELIVDGVNVDYRDNSKGWTFLRWAVIQNDADLVRYIVKHGSKVSDDRHRQDGMLLLEYAVEKYVKSHKGREDWDTIDALLKADDACASGFKDANRRLYVAAEALATIGDDEKLKKLQIEKEITELKKEYIGKVKSGDNNGAEKSLPKSQTLKSAWIKEASNLPAIPSH